MDTRCSHKQTRHLPHRTSQLCHYGTHSRSGSLHHLKTPRASQHQKHHHLCHGHRYRTRQCHRQHLPALPNKKSVKMTNRRSIRVIRAIRVSFFISHGFHRFLFAPLCHLSFSAAPSQGVFFLCFPCFLCEPIRASQGSP